MDVHTNIPLKNYLTMKLGGPARFMVDIHDAKDVRTVCVNANKQQVAIWVLGGGSNVVATDEGFGGIIIRIRIPGFEIIEDTSNSTTIKLGAGENWDSVVKRTVDMNLTGIEAMSGIPGTAGATPVQNVGAYGQEIADTFESLEAYDLKNDQMVVLSHEECKFAYRNSIFRDEWAGRFIITSITIKLSKNLPQPPFYEGLQKLFDERSVTMYTAQIVRDTVLEIRKTKLPNPEEFPNTGSFFKNAIVDKWRVDDLHQKYPDMPAYEMPENQYKVPSGWLIEQTGLKGQTLHGIRINEKNALVLINDSATSFNDLAMARDEVIHAVHEKFGILIEQEPLQIA